LVLLVCPQLSLAAVDGWRMNQFTGKPDYYQTGIDSTSTTTLASTNGTGVSIGSTTAPTMITDIWGDSSRFGLPDGTSGTKGFLRFRAKGGYTAIGMDFGMQASGGQNGWIQARDIGTGPAALLLNPLGGNVNIGGTATPSKTLQVTGTVAVSSDTYITTRNYEGSTNSWRLDLAIHQMFCLSQVPAHYSVAINAPDGTTCDTACSALTTYSACQSAHIYNDYAADSTRAGPSSCAGTDYIKYCCCKAP
jgi:hypothetical protein